ncbi:hypothetical protein MRB53_026552 [Persea americana]|uniref:Uncharacterized protein n=1 Tax=Persea americana TaxID=3435 RepID=A0ACC2LJ14_PERAE|nr:hypothetical protein MRB53_026552 [Persea americana]
MQCVQSIKYIHAVNIGDNSFMMVRKGRTYFHSPVHQHALDWPYQLGSDPNSDPPSLAVIAGTTYPLRCSRSMLPTMF